MKLLLFLNVYSCLFGLVMSVISDSEIEESLNVLLVTFLEKNEVDTAIPDKCKRVYSFCRRIGVVTGKVKGKEGQYCVIPTNCEALWKEGKVMRLKDDILDGLSTMLVGVDRKGIMILKDIMKDPI